MRITFKFTASLLVGIVGILTVDAWIAWRREVEFFAADMRQDHEMVGDFVAKVVRRTWVRDGREAALQVPRAIDEGGRHVMLGWVGRDGGADAIPAPQREFVARGQTVSLREAGQQHTWVPITGPGGEQLVLDVRESLDPEHRFSRSSLWWTGSVAVAVVGMSGLMTVLLGMLWLGRPMRGLCARAERIGGGDLSELPVRGRDEIAKLATSMNAMCRSLAMAREKLHVETERRVATLEQLRHADRLATVGKLAAGIAHELGTPLNVVWEQAKMIARGEVRDRDLVEGAQAIADEAAQMTRIIRQLLDFARPRQPEKVPLELGSLVERSLQLLEAMAQRRGITLELDIDGPCVVCADPAQLQQVLANLIVNAVQASSAGDSVTVRITASAPPGQETGDQSAATAVSAWHRIDVVDNGAGIADEHIDHLFEPFFTTKGVGEGTGLGLSVSRGIVLEHGGRMTVTSALGSGTTFSVFLPQGDPQ